MIKSRLSRVFGIVLEKCSSQSYESWEKTKWSNSTAFYGLTITTPQYTWHEMGGSFKPCCATQLLNLYMTLPILVPSFQSLKLKRVNTPSSTNSQPQLPTPPKTLLFNSFRWEVFLHCNHSDPLYQYIGLYQDPTVLIQLLLGPFQFVIHFLSRFLLPFLTTGVFTNKNTTPPPPKKEKKRKEKAPRTIIIMSLHYEWLIRHLFQSDPFFPLSSKFCFHSRLCWNLPASCTYFFWIQYLALKSHLASQELPVQLDYFSWLPVSAPSLFAILPACGTRLQGLPSILFLETPHLPLLTNLWPLRTMQIVGLFPWPVLIMPSFI